MKKTMAVLVLLIFFAGTAAAEETGLKLSLKEAIRLAIEKNLDLKAELYAPAQAEADIRKNRAIYETHLTLDGGYRDSTTYSPTSANGIDQSTLFLTPGAYKLLPSGGTLNLSYQNIQEKNSIPVTTGSYWTSALELSLSQPLLKNFGRDVTELNIRVSEYSKDTSISRLKNRILSIVSQVSIEYYKLVSFLQDMESKKVSLDLATKVLTETEARVKAGVTPAMEILNAQFGVSLREKDIIDAEKSVKDQVDVLRLLLQLDKVTDIAPVDTPSRVQISLDEADTIKKSLELRPDLEELKFQIATLELQSSVSRSQTLPSLNLNSSIGFTGLDTAYGRATERLGSLEYPAWSVGLQFDYPLGNESAENDYIRNRLKSEQARLQLESLKAAVATEVRTAIRTVQSSYKQLDVSDRARRYADERFNAYQKKSEVGLATNKDLLDVENDLATARSSQIKAQVAYATALIQLWQLTGELLEREGISVDSSRSDKLYDDMR